MVPESAATFVAFLLLIVPGLSFELLRERRRAALKDSPFREVSRIVLASLAFSGIALAFLSVVRAIRPSAMVDPGAWLGDGSKYLEAHYRLIAWSAVAEVILALLFVILFDKWLGRHGEGGTIQAESAWFDTFRTTTPPGTFPFVLVRLTDGRTFMGRVTRYSPDIALEDRELVLSPPLFYAPARDASNTEDQVPQELADPAWQRVVISGSAISSMAVSYPELSRDQAAILSNEDSLLMTLSNRLSP